MSFYKRTCSNSTLPPKKKKKFDNIWSNDQELNSYFDQLNTIYKSATSNKSEKEESIKSFRRKIKKRKSFLMNNFYQIEANKINLNAINREMKELFENAKNHKTISTNRSKCICPPEQLAVYFEKHFVEKNDENSNPEQLETIPTSITSLSNNSLKEAEINENPPTEEEIQTLINNLKSNKSSTDIPVEILKTLCNSKILIKELKSLFEVIWKCEKVPTHFEHSEITAIWKNKGKKSDPTNYRGIQVGSLIGKLFSILLINRIKYWYDSQILDLQNGFRPGRGTTDGVHITKSTQIIAEKTNQEVYTAFIDLQNAFDHVNRDWLFQSIRNRLPAQNKNNKIINLLFALYQHTTAQITNQPHLNFDIKLGVASRWARITNSIQSLL